VADFTEVLKPPGEQRLIEAAYYRGQLHLERGHRQEALADFDLVVKENPSFAPVYLSRAQVQFLQGDDNRGLDDLTTYLDLARPTPLDPKGGEVFALRGRLLRHIVSTLPRADAAAKLAIARTQLEQAIHKGFRSAEVYDDLGSVLQLLGACDRALAAYGQALAGAPQDHKNLQVRAHNKRGWIYAQDLQPPQYDKARNDFAETVRLDSKNAEAHTGLGYVWARQKRRIEAQHEADRALLWGGGDYLVLHNAACIYAELSRMDKGQAGEHQDMAMDLLRQAVELWRPDAAGPTNEIDLIRKEPSFEPLKGRADFKKLVAEKRP